MAFSCVVLAAGLGERFSAKKQELPFLNDKALWQWVKDTCYKVTDDVLVVGQDIAGGKTRQESVRIGINNIRHERVVILEAARPLVQAKDIEAIGNAESLSISYYADMIDTPMVYGLTYKRDAVKHFLVPQAFDTDMLVEAHDHTRLENATDDTQLMKRRWGVSPKLVLGDRYSMYKVTYPEDMLVIEALKHIYIKD